MEDRNFPIGFLSLLLCDEKNNGMTIYGSDNRLRCMSLKEARLFKHLSTISETAKVCESMFCNGECSTSDHRFKPFPRHYLRAAATSCGVTAGPLLPHEFLM